jgi:nucleotide-binding universal stress UspA family protein
MRVLLAIDGSVPSDKARDLVASLPFPAGSTIRIVGVLEHGPELFGLPWIPVTPENGGSIEHELVTRFMDTLMTAERDIARPGIAVDHILLRGHAARAIVDEARQTGVDLVVVGCRGHGAFGTTVLGSVSAEVVDHAPCPVLVARGPRIRSILFAEDGSEGARGAAQVIDESPILAGLPVTVLSVSETGISWAGAAPGTYEAVMEPYSESLEGAHREHADLADRRAGWLARNGRDVRPQVRDGDPAAEIVATAAQRGTDLVVVGTRGHTGLTRMILGSVARNVLIHAPCSVLVVREGVGPAADPGELVGAGAAEGHGRH